MNWMLEFIVFGKFNMKHLILLPCRGRPQNILRFLESYKANTSPDTDLVIGIDKDDINNHSILNTHKNIMIMDKCNLSEKLNIMWKSNPGYDYYSFLADDTIIHTPNWDVIFMNYIENNFNGYGIVFANDLKNPRTEEGHYLPNHWTISGSLLNIMGFFSLPVCNHMWIDNFTLQLGMKLNSIKYMDDVIIEHRHIRNGDDVYRHSEQFFNTDKEQYENFMFTKFNSFIDTIKECIDSRNKLKNQYIEFSGMKTDINEHLPILRKYALDCKHITEFGSRGMHSSLALLSAYPEKAIFYDINHPSKFGVDLDSILELAKQSNIEMKFNICNVLSVDIEETDLLFIDTWHTYIQLKNELKKHGSKVRKYIIFHDTTLFGESDEKDWYGLRTHETETRGLNAAINEFLQENSNWILLEKLENNNGLTIIKNTK